MSHLPTNKPFFTISEAAEFLGISLDTIRRYDKQGILTSVRLDGKNRSFAHAELTRFLSTKKLSISEAAEYLKISISTLRRLETRGEIQPTRNSRGERLYDVSALENYRASKKAKKDVDVSLRGENESERRGNLLRDSGVGFASADDSKESQIDTSTALSVKREKIATTAERPRDDKDRSLEKEERGSLIRSGMTAQNGQVETAKSSSSNHSIIAAHKLFEERFVQVPELKIPEYLPQESASYFGRNFFTRRSKMMVVSLGMLFLLISSASVMLLPAKNSQSASKDINLGKKIAPSVLAANTKTLYDQLTFNIKAIFKTDTIFEKSIDVGTDSVFRGNVTLTDTNLDAGEGEVTASNLLYSIIAGEGVVVSGDPQNPTISMDGDGGVTSFQGSTGDVTLTAGSGISISGTTISNTDAGSGQKIFSKVKVGSDTISASNNTDTLELAAGTGVTLLADSTNKKVTITATAVASGWVDDGTTVRLDTASDNVGIGTTTPSEKLTVAGNVSISSNLLIGGESISDFTGDGLLVGSNQLQVGLITAADGTGSTSSFSGLEFQSNRLTLLQGCSNSQVLKWNDATSLWECGADAGDTSTAIIHVTGNSGGYDSTNTHTLNFQSDFTLSESPSGVTNVAIDYATTGIARKGQNETITGSWTFSNAVPFSLSNTAATIPIGAGGSLTFTDGSNTLLTLTDAGTTGNLAVTGIFSAATNETINGIDISSGTVSDIVNLTINSGGDLTIGTIGLNDIGTDNLTAGASLIGVFDELANSNGTTVQDVLDDLDAAISATGATQYWQRNAGALSPINTTDDVLLGGTATSSALIKLAGTSGGDSYFNTGGNVGIGTTAPTNALLEVTSATSGTGIWVNGTAALGSSSGGGINLATNANPTAVNHRLGLLGYYGPLGSGAAITAWSSEAWSSSARGTHLRFETIGIGTTFRREKLRIEADGNVGIGTTAPLGKLNVEGQAAGNALVTFNNTGDQNIFTASQAGTTKFTITNTGNIGFAGGTSFINTLTSAATAARTYTFPDASGDVCLTTGNCAGSGGGIVGTGTTNFVTKFTGSGTIGNSTIFDDGTSVGIGTSTPVGFFNVSGQRAGQALTVLNQTGDQAILTGSVAGSTKFVFDNNGNLGIGTTTPGYLLDVSGGSGIVAQFSGRVIGANAANSNEFVTLSQLTGGVGQFWQRANGTLAPTNITDDVLIGSSTSTSSALIRFAGTSGQHSYFNTGGNLGIGTTAPTSLVHARLDHDGLTRITAENRTAGTVAIAGFSAISDGGAGSLLTTSASYTAVGPLLPDQLVLQAEGGLSNGLLLRTVASDIVLAPNNVTAMTVKNGGNIGIGTTAPSSFKLQVAGNVGPNADVTYDLGSASLRWNNIYAANIIGASSGTQGYWQRSAGALSPTNITDDVLVGGTATSSALIRLAGLSGQSSYFNTGGDVGIGTTSPNITGFRTGATLTIATPNTAAALEFSGNTSAASTIASITARNEAMTNGLNKRIGQINFVPTSTTPDDGGFINFLTNQQGTNSERMRIMNTGNIGIGVLAAQSTLHVAGQKNGARAAVIIDQLATGTGSDILTGSAAGTTKFVFDNNGNLGIGTTAPGAKLELSEAVSTINPALILSGSMNSVNAGHSIDFRHGTASFARVAGVTNTSGITGELSLWTSTSLNSAAAERVRINGAGNVGIGTTDPSASLHITSTTLPGFILNHASQSRLQLQVGGTNMFLVNHDGTIGTIGTQSSGGALALQSNGTERMRIDSNGNVGIGTTAPVGKLNVDGQVAGKALAIFNQTGNQDIFTASSAGTTRFTIANDGTIKNSLIPNLDVTYDLGSSSLRWNNIYAANIIGASSGTQGYWQRNSGALSPTNITDDVLLGATATSSALVRLGGTTNADSYFNSGGNLGIGTTTTASKLQVLSGASTVPALQARGTSSAGDYVTVAQFGASSTVPLYISAHSGGSQALTSWAAYDQTDDRWEAISTTTVGATQQFFNTDGSISFKTQASAARTAGDALTFNDTLHLAGSGNVGIGTTAPVGKLNVDGQVAGKALAIFNQTGNQHILTGSVSGTTKFLFDNNGNLGIGATTTLAANLHIDAPAQATGERLAHFGISDATAGYLRINNVTSTDGIFIPRIEGRASNTNISLYLQGNAQAGDDTGPLPLIYLNAAINSSSVATRPLLQLANGGSTVWTVAPNGGLGIGTTTPGGLLNLNGSSIGKSLAILNQTGDQAILTGSSAGTTRFVFDYNGNLGIGTTLPNTGLQVANTGSSFGGLSPQAILSDTAAPAADAGGTLVLSGITTTGTTNQIGFGAIRGGKENATSGNQQGYLALFTRPTTGNLTERLRINSAGNVGIGTTAPVGLLNIDGQVAGKALAVFNQTGNQAILTASQGGTTKFVIDNNGNVGIGVTAPAAPLEIDAASNSLGIRLKGLAETTEIADMYVSTVGALVLDTTVGNDSQAYIDLRGEDNEFGLVLRDSSGVNTSPYANFYMNDAATDYLNINVTATNATAGLVLQNGGNVGIGTTSPEFKLDVSGSVINNNSSFYYGRNSANTAIRMLGTSADDVYIGAIDNAGGKVFFREDGSTRMTIDGGNLGIGTTDPIAKLDVDGSASLSGSLFFTSTLADLKVLNGNRLDFQTSPGGDAGLAVRMTLTNAGNLGIGTATPTSFMLQTAGSVGPNADATYDLGSSSLRWNNIYAANIIGASTGTQGYWQRSSGALSPTNITDDVLLGATATSSALVKFGGTTNARSYFNTGGNVGIGTTNPLKALHVSFADETTPASDLSSFEGLRITNTSSTVDTGAGLHLESSVNGGAISGILGRGIGTDRSALDFYTEGGLLLRSVKMTINDRGNVGIGTTAPVGKLNVDGQIAGKALAIFNQTGNQDIFTASSAGTTRFVIANDGNVGIGTTAPAQKLHVSGGDILLDHAQFLRGIRSSGSTEIPLIGIPSGTNTTRIGMPTSNAEVGLEVVSSGLVPRFVVYGSGNVGIGTTTPIGLLNVSGQVAGKSLVTLNQTGNQAILTGSAAGATKFVFNNDGNLGIGTTSPTAPVDISKAYASVAGAGLNINVTQNASNFTNYGAQISVTNTQGGNGGDVYGLDILADKTTNTGVHSVYGVNVIANAGARAGGASITPYYGGKFVLNGSTGSSSTATNMSLYGLYGEVINSTAEGEVSSSYGVYGKAATVSTGTAYGVYASATGGDTNYGIYSAAGTNYFNGNVGIGTTTPTNLLQVAGDAINVTSSGSTAISYATRADSLTFTRGDLPSSWKNKITNSWNSSPLSSTTMNFELATGASTNITAMTLNGLGNVGIGNTAPAATLHVSGLKNGARAATIIDQLATGTGSDILTGSAAGATRFVFNNSGNLGIGTTAPATTIEAATATGGTLRLSSTDTTIAAAGEVLGRLEMYSADATSNAAKVYSSIQSISEGLFDGSSTNRAGLAFSTGGFSDSDTERLRIAGTGNVGIGTTAPISTLHVAGQKNGARSALIVDQLATGTGSDLFTASAAGTTRFVVDNAGKLYLGALDIETGNTSAVCWFNNTINGQTMKEMTDCNGSATDLAENFGTEDASIEAGDVVEITGDAEPVVVKGIKTSKAFIQKSQGTYRNSILGVVSTQPNHTYGEDGVFSDAENPRPVALAGRVPVKVSAENGPILVGDSLTSSSTPGVAMKATQPGFIIGRALEAYSGGGTGKVIMHVSVAWVDPTIYISDSGVLQTDEGTVTPGSSLFAGFVNQPLPKTAGLGNISQRVNELTHKLAQLEGRIDGIGSSSEPTIVSSSSADVNQLQNSVAGLQSSVFGLQTSMSDLTSKVDTLASASAFMQQALDTVLMTSSESASLTQTLSNLSIASATVSGNLMVLGRTTVEDLGVTGNITAGVMNINGLDGAINTVGEPLKLQSHGLFGVDILDGKVTIATNGDIKTKGKVIAEEVETKKLTIDVEPVASSSAVLNASVGTAVIEAGETSIDVKTSMLTNDSLIFTTPDSAVAVGTKKINSNTFQITIDTEQLTDLKINWWIVDRKQVAASGE